MPLNPNLDDLTDYPFEALRTLLSPVTPRVNDEIILMSVGEPQHQPPALLAETLAAHAHEWNKYPPMAGTPDLRQAICDWLAWRYHLGANALAVAHDKTDVRRRRLSSQRAMAEGGLAVSRSRMHPRLTP